MGIKERYINFILKNHRWVLLLLIIFTGVMMWETSRIRMRTNFFELYPPRHPFIKVYREYRKLFGTANLLLIVLEPKKGDIYTVEFIKTVDEVTRFILDTKGVNPFQVLSLTHPNVRGFRVRGFWIESTPIVEYLPSTEEDIENIKKAVEINPGVKGFIVSEDYRATLVVAGLWEEELDFEYLFRRMAELKNIAGDVNIYITGYPLLYAWIHSYIPSIYIVFLITGISLAVLLFLYFGELKGVVIPFMAGILSALWAIGFTKIIGFELDPLLLVVPVLLSARALSHSVQVMERYYELYFTIKDKYQSILKSFSELYTPALLSILTDGLGILTIAVSGIPLMWKLALYSSLWIGSIFLGVLTLSPVMLLLFSPPKGIRKTSYFYQKFSSSHKIFTQRNLNTYLTIFFLILALIVSGIIGRKLKVGNVMPGHAILKEDHPYNVAMDKVNSYFYGANQFVIIADTGREGGVKEIEALQKIEELERFMIENTGATASLSLPQVVKLIMKIFHENDPNWEVLPYKARDVGAITYTLSGGREMQRLFSEDFKSSPVTFFYKTFSNEKLKEIVKKAKEFIEKEKDGKVEFKLAGGLLGVLYAVNDEVERSYWLILEVVLLTTAFLVLVFMRSIVSVFILLPSLLLSQFLSETFMFFAGIDMNINSLPVAAVGIGVGIDYGIYLLSMIKQLLNTGYSKREAIETALMTTGKAIFFTASTMVAGLIFWFFAPMKFTAEMALLLAILMVLNMEGALIFVPVLSMVFLKERSEPK
jgi:predicted RND superfamily exporter protein